MLQVYWAGVLGRQGIGRKGSNLDVAGAQQASSERQAMELRGLHSAHVYMAYKILSKYLNVSSVISKALHLFKTVFSYS